MAPPKPSPNARPNARNAMSAALGRFRSALVTAGVASFFVNLLMLVSPVYMLQIYDRVLISSSYETLLMLTVIAVVLLGMMALLDFLRVLIMVRVAAGLDTMLQGRAFEAVFRRSLLMPGGGRGRALSDLDTVRSFMGSPALFSFFDAPWIPLYLAVVYLIHPTLGHVALGGSLVLIILALLTHLVSRAAMEKAGQASVAAGAFADTSLRNAEAIAAMGMLGGLRRLWAERRRGAVGYQSSAAQRVAAVTATSRFVRLTVQVAILGAGAMLVIQQEITPGMMIAASILMGRGLAPIEQMVGAWRTAVGARTAYRRLNLLMTLLPPEDDSPRIQLPRPQGRVTVEQLVGRAPGNGPVILKGINLAIAPGEAVGIIGETGAGKSSLVRYIVGVWEPFNGSVRLDNADVAQWPAEDLGRHVGYLPQDVELFEGTVGQNICRFGEGDSAAIITAAKLAGVHELILRLPNGYETMVREDGAPLSGGQRQRVALARAVYGDPALVVLDEPNANLDTAGEAAVKAAIERLKETKVTQIVIAHRPSLMTSLDRLVVLRDGAVEQQGTPAEILERYRTGSAAAPANVTLLNRT